MERGPGCISHSREAPGSIPGGSTRHHSSVGQSDRLLTDRSEVQILLVSQLPIAQLVERRTVVVLDTNRGAQTPIKVESPVHISLGHPFESGWEDQTL